MDIKLALSIEEVSILMEDYQNKIRTVRAQLTVAKAKATSEGAIKFFTDRLEALEARYDVLHNHNQERLEAMQRKQ